MFASKIRVGMLGLMVMLLVGSYAATAYAEPGPFCHQRVNSEGGTGNKITEAAPEFVQGEGGEQKLEGSGVALVATSVQVKGIIYNNADQCQAKLELKYHNPTWVGHTCTITVGTDNSVKVFGHLAWKWDGTTKQLEENPQKEQTPDWIFTHSELNTKGELKALPKEEFTTISFKGGTGEKECALLSNQKPKVEGSVGVTILSPVGLEQWSRKESDAVQGGQLKQHIWVSGLKPPRFVGVETGLSFNGASAKLVGGFLLNADFDEVAYFEKS